MDLLNFSISTEEQTVSLACDERGWDLHNFATFLEPDLVDDQLTLTWEIEPQYRDQENPWGDRANRSTRLQLVFRAVKWFRDSGLRTEEDQFVSLILLLGGEPGARTCDSIRFEMEGGRVLEVASATAELVPGPNAT